MHEEDMTEEDRAREHLRENPAMELGLWQEWVLVVCRHLDFVAPTGAEWDALMRDWHHGKAPLTSAYELQKMRETPNVPMSRTQQP